MAPLPPHRESRWTDRLSRSGYFMGALLLHLLVFLLVAARIIWPAPPQEPVVLQGPVNLGCPIVSLVKVVSPPLDPSNAVSGPANSLNVITGELPGSLAKTHFKFSEFTNKSAGSDADGAKIIREFGPKSPHVDGLKERYSAIHTTVTKNWGRTDAAIAAHDPACTFPVYVASYANGDWACNTRLDADGNIVAGAIPDLVAKIAEWNHGMKGKLMPKPLNIGSQELLDIMPTFVFFTGHKDFVLTDAEIDNLRSYLMRGGAVWGDNAMAGQGSRFDVAFRREMKRVVPDVDKNFEPFKLSDDIFIGGRSPMTEVPRGMNYYAELPEHLDIDGQVAIVYTPNDYSDLMFMRVLPGDKEVYVPDRVPPGTLYTDQAFWYQRGTYYRNFNLESSLAAHHLGMNIVSFLLTRFDNILLLND